MKRKKHSKVESQRLGYLMTIPASILILVVCIYPLLSGITLSFQNYNLLRPQGRAFNGLENFARLLREDKEFTGALGYTFIYTIGTVIISYVMGLILALLMNRKMKGKGIYRTLILLPWVMAPSVAVTNWSLLFNDRLGFINSTLKQFGLIEKNILFLADPNWAKLSAIITDVWRDFPFMMVVLLAGMQSIPSDLYESAYIDGAGYWQGFRYITMPMIRGVSAISAILMFIWVFNRFDNIYLLTGGGPNGATFTLPILSYYTAFYRGNIGYASAMAVIMLVVMTVVALIYLRINRAEEL